MILTYQRGDLVEYQNLYWRVMFCNPANETLDLRNAAGRSVEDVSFNLITPCASTIKSAIITANNDLE